GRMTEHFGKLLLRKGHGSGMIRLVLKVSVSKGEALRSGNTSPWLDRSKEAHCPPCLTTSGSAWSLSGRCSAGFARPSDGLPSEPVSGRGCCRPARAWQKGSPPCWQWPGCAWGALDRHCFGDCRKRDGLDCVEQARDRLRESIAKIRVPGRATVPSPPASVDVELREICEPFFAGAPRRSAAV